MFYCQLSSNRRPKRITRFQDGASANWPYAFVNVNTSDGSDRLKRQRKSCNKIKDDFISYIIVS